MTKVRKRSPNSLLLRLVALCGGLVLACCDQFSVSICKFEDRPGCKVDWSASLHGGDGGQGTGMDMKPPADPQNGPERKFEWSTSIAIDGTTKFVGMQGWDAVTWKNDSGNYFRAWSFDLNNPDFAKRALFHQCDTCPDFTNVGDLQFSTDQIYVTGGFFYKLKYHAEYGLYLFDSNARTLVPDIILSSSAIPRPFAHPTTNALVASTQKSNVYDAGFATFKNQSVKFTASSNSNSLTSFLVGDIDATDQKPNGPEIVAFSGPGPLLLQHLNSETIPPENDAELLTALSNTIFLSKGGDESPLISAFVADLNKDNFPDLLYVRNRSIYITSYLGRFFGKFVPTFQNWSAPISLTELNSEAIRSLMALDLTNDSYPDLIIETDKAVHFYVNKAK